MKKIITLLALMLIVGCSNQVDQLNGAWKCDANATIEALQTPEDKKNMGSGFAKMFVMTMLESAYVFIDTEKKQINMAIGRIEQKGQLNIISENSDGVQIEVDGRKATFTVVDDDTLHVKNLGESNSLSVVIFKKVTQ